MHTRKAKLHQRLIGGRKSGLGRTAIPARRLREIFFHARMNDDTVYVTIRNPVAGEVKLKNGVPQTSKRDKSLHGYGFRSIKKAAAHYGSNNVQCVVENGFFELRLFLRIGQ